MALFLVYRHGSNAANQSVTPVMAVAIVDAPNELEARSIVAGNITVYANQFLSFVPDTEVDIDDWNDVCSRDADLCACGEPSIIY